MIRWHAELYIGRVRRALPVPDAIFSSADKDKAIGGILPYIATMVEPNDEFYIVVRSIEIK